MFVENAGVEIVLADVRSIDVFESMPIAPNAIEENKTSQIGAAKGRVILVYPHFRAISCYKDSPAVIGSAKEG